MENLEKRAGAQDGRKTKQKHYTICVGHHYT
jgi:hypothetical protein